MTGPDTLRRAIVWRSLKTQCLLAQVRSVEEAVDRCAGLSGAVPSSLLSLAARVRGFTPEALTRAIEAKKLVRVPAMRGAFYLLPAERAGDGLALADPGPALATLDRAGLDGAGYQELAGAVEGTLAGRRLTGPEIRKALAAAGGPAPPSTGAWTLVLRAMSHEGRILAVGARGGPLSQKFEYAATKEWLGRVPLILDKNAALARMAPWYLQAHGPASAADFAWWSGVHRTAAARALETGGFLPMPGPGEPHYVVPAALEEIEKAPKRWKSLLLLPHWDALLMAHDDRSRFLETGWKDCVVDPHGNTTNVLLVDGRVAGVWDCRGTELSYALLETSITRSRIMPAVRRLSGVLGKPRLVARHSAPSLTGANSFMSPLARRGTGAEAPAAAGARRSRA
jgi:prepilin-type processing-associated H-X9-DG protein